MTSSPILLIAKLLQVMLQRNSIHVGHLPPGRMAFQWWRLVDQR